MKDFKITPLIFSEALSNHPVYKTEQLLNHIYYFQWKIPKIKLTIFLFFLKIFKEKYSDEKIFL